MIFSRHSVYIVCIVKTKAYHFSRFFFLYIHISTFALYRFLFVFHPGIRKLFIKSEYFYLSLWGGLQNIPTHPGRLFHLCTCQNSTSMTHSISAPDIITGIQKNGFILFLQAKKENTQSILTWCWCVALVLKLIVLEFLWSLGTTNRVVHNVQFTVNYLRCLKMISMGKCLNQLNLSLPTYIGLTSSWGCS